MSKPLKESWYEHVPNKPHDSTGNIWEISLESVIKQIKAQIGAQTIHDWKQQEQKGEFCVVTKLSSANRKWGVLANIYFLSKGMADAQVSCAIPCWGSSIGMGHAWAPCAIPYPTSSPTSRFHSTCSGGALLIPGGGNSEIFFLLQSRGFRADTHQCLNQIPSSSPQILYFSTRSRVAPQVSRCNARFSM